MRKNVFVLVPPVSYLCDIISDKVNHKHVKKIILLGVCVLGINFNWLHSQSVWPGDVTNNGLVNAIDILYHGIASGTQGAPREFPGPDWVEHPLPSPWADSYSNGLNFAYADCNGDGKVNEADINVIENNFGNSHEGVIPDVFTEGNPAIDPTLLLEAATPAVNPGGVARIKVSLGDEVRPVQNFYGITFTLNFDPALVSDQPNSVRFRLKQNTFITEPNSGTTSYSMVEEEAGTAEMTVLRQSLETTNGFGEIGTFIVVMEDIILLNEGNAHFSVGNIKMLDTEQNEYPIASSELDVEIQGNGNNGNNNLAQIRSVELRSDVQIFSQLEEEELWIEADNQNNTIEKIEIINEEDEVLVSKNIANIRKKAIINLNKYPTGNYILKIYSADGISSHLIVK